MDSSLSGVTSKRVEEENIAYYVSVESFYLTQYVFYQSVTQQQVMCLFNMFNF